MQMIITINILIYNSFFYFPLDYRARKYYLKD